MLTPIKLLGLGLLLGSLLPAGARAQEYYYFHAINNGMVTITGYYGPGGVVVIPSTIYGLPVTGIGDYAFNSHSDLTAVTIPNGVTNIGDYSFYSCTSLTNVTIPDSVTGIGDGAFYICTSLSNVIIPKNVTRIERLHFSGPLIC